MKRVIDIENDYYEIIKYNVENGYDYKPLVIIANSMPYEPNLSDDQIEKITDLLENEWGYEGMREDVSRILRGDESNGK